MKFSQVMDLARCNFPVKYYGGTFLDYNQLQDILTLLQAVSEDTQISYKNQTFKSGETLLMTALDTEITKVSRHFLVIEHRVKRSWRIVEGLEPKPNPTINRAGAYAPKIDANNTDQAKIDDFEPIPVAKLGRVAKWCWQYAQLNAAALQRILSDHDVLLNSRKGRLYMEACLRGNRKEHAQFMDNVKLEEVKAIARMQEAWLDQAADSQTAVVINMALLDCSFSDVWKPATLEDPYHCSLCKRVMTQPVGLICGDIICYRCHTALVEPPKDVNKSGSFMSMHRFVKRSQTGSDMSKLKCPVCHKPGALEGATNMPALAMSNKRRLQMERNSGPESAPASKQACGRPLDNKNNPAPAAMMHG